MEYKKNQTVEVKIEDMSENGEGIGKIDGYTLFIKDALQGDVVRAVITKVKKNYGFARVNEIIRPSDDRITAPCKNHKQCGGCQIQALSYEAQLSYKNRKVFNDLVRIGGFDQEELRNIAEDIIGMDDPFRYRNKTNFPIGRDKNGNIISGFYAKRTHDIIKTEDCLIGIEENKIIIDIVLKHMEKYGIEPYDEKTGKGKIRHVFIRKGFETGEISVCIVIKNDEIKSKINRKKYDFLFFEGEKELANQLGKITYVRNVIININNRNTNVILGDEFHVMWGEPVIHDVLLGMKYEISPGAFYQVNPSQTEKLYGTVLEYADLKGNEEVWDICCGIGTIALSLSGSAGKVHGIEIVEDAVKDAERNAFINNVDNAEFICGAAEEYLPYNKESIKADLIIMDPPRKGMATEALDAVLFVSPPKIIYVSCDPATLARDLKYLCSNGYRLIRFRPVDMFPHTVHVETVCLLERK
ncbi:MAG: 23S rRNA (uracil(1939)-C(5))-methyltransferase RlmD [Lachnospiraceae bacterium]|nr:23S rRNA (uracil(1939)-C(5))-methyltransferase RlmD [Lachnospiraceae bacterium]